MEAVTGGECSFKATVFKDETGEEEMGRRHLDGELEGDNPTLRFDFTRVREGGRRRHMKRWRGPKGSSGAAGNSQRWEMSGESRPSGLRRLVDQLGRCKAFGPGEEGGCRGLSWAKKAGQTGHCGGLRDEKEKG
jgi:hypothetical protein